MPDQAIAGPRRQANKVVGKMSGGIVEKPVGQVSFFVSQEEPQQVVASDIEGGRAPSCVQTGRLTVQERTEHVVSKIQMKAAIDRPQRIEDDEAPGWP
jgi:hypothetical protein